MEIDDRRPIDNDYLIDIDWYQPIDDQSIVTKEIFLITLIAISYHQFSSIAIICIHFWQHTDCDDDHPQDEYC